MRLRLGLLTALLVPSLAPACKLAPYVDSDGAGESTSTGSTGTGASTAVTTGGESFPGCDVVLRGDQDDTASVQAALDGATDGSTICFAGGFSLGPVSVSGKADLTLRNAYTPGRNFDIPDAPMYATLNFGGAAGDGLTLTDMSGVTVRALEIKNTGGNGLSVRDSERVALQGLFVYPDDAPSDTNGLFGIRVGGSKQVLIEGCQVTYAADAGILAIDSSEVVMRHNQAAGNVTGLQAENSERVEIHDNITHANALGIFVVDLPTAPSGIGEVLIRDNQVTGNDGANFAPAGSLPAAIPSGIGVMVLATDTVEIRNNTITDNPTTGVAVVSFETVALLNPLMGEPDPGYDAYPETIDIHDNTVSGNGLMPADLFASVFMLDPMADLAWDGVADANKDNADGHLNLCIRNNGDADFVDLDALNLGADKSFDLAPHDCAHPPVAPVDLPR